MSGESAASPRLAMAAALTAGCLTISAAPALAAGSPAAAKVVTGSPDPSRGTANGRIAFSDFITHQMYTVNPDGTGLVQLTREPAGIAARWPHRTPVRAI